MNRYLLILSMVAALLVGACTLDSGEANYDGDSAPSGVALVASFSQVGVGESLQFEAVVDGNFQASKEVKWRSSDKEVATVSAEGVVTGVALGKASISVESAVKASLSDSVEIEVVPCHQPLEISSRINEEVTWGIRGEDECVHYRLAGNVSLSAKLNIEPGVRIEAMEGSGIQVNGEGEINAVGSAEKKIRFFAKDPAAGWRGIKVTTKRLNKLEHVDMGHCGAGDRWLGSDQGTACVYVRSGKIALKNSTFHDSKGLGVGVHSNSDSLEGFAANDFYGNQVPLLINPHQIHQIDGASNFSSDEEKPNARESVAVLGGNVSDVPLDGAVWPALKNGYPYRVGGVIQLNQRVSVEAGARFTFEQGSGIQVRNGSLKAVGTEEALIVFEGVEDTPGYWQGFKIESKDQHNELRFVEVANGGGGAWLSSDAGQANILVRGGSVKIQDTLIRDSARYGLVVHSASDSLSGFSNNRFAGNEAPVRINATQVSELDSETVFEADSENPNTVQGVEVRGATVSSGSGASLLWPALHDGYPYVFYDTTTLTTQIDVAPGAVINFAQHGAWLVSGAGALKAVGSSAAPITFQGNEDSLAYWSTIKITTKSQHNEIDHAVFENGAGGKLAGSDKGEAFLLLRGGALKVSNSSFGEVPVGKSNTNPWAIACQSSSDELDLGGGNTFADSARAVSPECQ